MCPSEVWALVQMPGFKFYLSLPPPWYVNLACCYLLCIWVFTCKIEKSISLPPEIAIKMNWENICKCLELPGPYKCSILIDCSPPLLPRACISPSAINGKCTSFSFRHIEIWTAILPLTIRGHLKYCLFSPHLSSLILNAGMTFTLCGDTVLWFFLHLVIQRGVNESLLCAW